MSNGGSHKPQPQPKGQETAQQPKTTAKDTDSKK